MTTITLLTDFGLKDGYAGVLKGVIWKIAPDAQIADISHMISPQNVIEGALTWGRVAGYFPDGTVHIGVIDPGVGTHRRAIAAHIGRQFYVVPDNGLISVVWNQAVAKGENVKFVHMDNPRYWLPEVSNIFHGRDIFSSAGAYLAAGVAFSELGAPIDDPVRIEIPKPERIPGGWRSPIIAEDHFGNLTTALTREHVDALGDVVVQVGGKAIPGLVKTFGERPAGSLVALFNSTGNLDISVVNGNAARRLETGVGGVVDVISREQAGRQGRT